jgi:integrase/recombinase XerD
VAAAGKGAAGAPAGDRAPLDLDAEEFLSWLSVERGRSANTLSAYRRDLVGYQTWLRRRGVPLAGVAKADVGDYVAWLRADGRAPATVARALVAVRSLHRFLLDEGRAGDDPTCDVGAPKVPQGLPKALSEAEIIRLLDAVAGDDAAARRDRAMLELLYGTGMRISELVGLSLGDLILSDGLLRAYGKGSKERLVPVGRYAAAALTGWLGPRGREMMVPAQWRRRHDSDAVFLNARGGRLSRQGAWGVVRRHGDRAGLGAALTPHVLRHSCATHMLDHGADIRVVQELLGHASIATTQVYTRVSAERLRSAYDAAHPRARARSRT